MQRWMFCGIALVVAGAAWSCSKPDPGATPGASRGEAMSSTAGGGPGRGRRAGAAVEGEARGGGRRGRGWSGTVVQLSDEQVRTLGLETITVAPAPFRTTLRAMGEVAVPLPRKALVGSSFPARILLVHAGVGSWVRRGQPLVTVQSDEVGSARTEYQKAVVALDLARRTLEREQRLFDGGVGAQKALLTAQNDMKVAEANRLAAERRLHVYGMSDEDIRKLETDHGSPADLVLASPIDGKVVESTAVLGAMIDASEEILTVVDTRVLWVDAEIFERDIARVRLGQKASIRVPAYPDEVFEGTVSYVGDVVRPETKTIAVRTEVPNPDQRLKPGMFANVVFQTSERASVLALPATAILDDDGRHLVFVRTPSGYEPRDVEVGESDNGRREVVRGLSPGDVVVVAGHYQLKSKLYETVVKGGHSH